MGKRLLRSGFGRPKVEGLMASCDSCSVADACFLVLFVAFPRRCTLFGAHVFFIECAGEDRMVFFALSHNCEDGANWPKPCCLCFDWVFVWAVHTCIVRTTNQFRKFFLVLDSDSVFCAGVAAVTTERWTFWVERVLRFSLRELISQKCLRFFFFNFFLFVLCFSFFSSCFSFFSLFIVFLNPIHGDNRTTSKKDGNAAQEDPKQPHN